MNGVPIPLLRSVDAFAPATVGNAAVGFDVLGFAIEGPGDRVRVSVAADGPPISLRSVSGVVLDLPLVVELEVPDELAFPGELLNPAAGPGSGEDSLAIAQLGGPQQVTIVQQVRFLARRILALPHPHDLSLNVDQVGLG